MFHRRVVASAAIACLIAGSGTFPTGVAARDPQLHGVPPTIEGMRARFDEMRTLPDAASAGIVVTTLADTSIDDGACSLREAITAANTDAAGPDSAGGCPAGTTDDEDVITFATGGVITLSAALPTVDTNLVIDGTTAPTPITIDGGDTYRPFTVSDQVMVELQGLTITNGASNGTGGAVRNAGMLFLTEVSVTSSWASTSGGGIYTTTTGLTVLEDASVTGNTTGGHGGGIGSDGVTAAVGSLIAGNQAVGGGGGIALTASGSGVIYNSTLQGNAATGGAAGGGAIESANTLELTNVTIVGNSAAAGGGVRDTGDLEMKDTTVTGNAAASGSGVSSTGSPLIFSSMIIGNTGSAPELGATLDPGSAHNLTALPSGVTLAQVLDVAGLADNGGPTQTVALVRDAANPAWGGGDPDLCGDLPIDQRGYARTTPCDIGAFEIDDKAPAMKGPAMSVVASALLSGSSIAGKVTWSATDGGSGVAAYELQVSVNGAAYVPVAIDPKATSSLPRFKSGSTYKFRARAVDVDGNQSAWATSPRVTARLLQQKSTGITYSSGWKTQSKSAFSGGSAKYSKSKGAWVKLVATGRTFSFVTTKAASRGKAKVYVDGKYVTTIDLKATPTSYRVQAWSKTYTTSKRRTIKIVLLGTSGRPRVDADAFIVLK